MEHKLPTKFLALDLEMNQPSKRIIQIGACVGDVTNGEILETLSVFVNPNEELAPFIIDLTGIKQEDVDSGMNLPEAYDKLVELFKKQTPFINPVTWGGGDIVEIFNQLNKYYPDHKFDNVFGRRWIDVKTLFVCWKLGIGQGNNMQGGLAKSLTKFGLKFEGKKHNATDDAVNTFRMYCAMLKKFTK